MVSMKTTTNKAHRSATFSEDFGWKDDSDILIVAKDARTSKSRRE